MAVGECFEFPVRIYYEDTDAGGVVYYANYLRFMERARTEWLRALGFEQRALWNEQQTAFIVRRVEANYRTPARLDDRLVVRTRATRVGRAGITMAQEIVFEAAGEVVVEGRVELACIDVQTMKPRRTPTALREALAGGEAS